MATKTMQATQPPQTTLAQPEPLQQNPQPANQLAPIDLIRTGLDKMTPNLALALPRHIPVERFKRTVLTALNLNPDLVSADRRSLFNAAQKAAQDGLLPDGREGALVIFKERDTGKKNVQWMPMVFGIIKKLRQSGEIASITARVVYKNEFDQARFRYVIDGGEERLSHEPILVGERGPAVLVYASAKFKDGTIVHEPLTMEDVKKARSVSKTGNKEYGPWTQWTDEMMRKTAIRRLSKYLPLSAEDQRTLDHDLAEPTEFQELKQEAIASQSIAAARRLGAPEPETPHDAETGEVIEAEAVEPQQDYEPGTEG